MKIPPELSQAIRDDKLVIFVGAGLSWNLKNQQGEQLEGWDNMVLKILEDLKEKGFEVDHFTSLVGKCEPVKILDLIESDKGLNKDDIAGFIKDFVDLSEENNFSLHKKLFQLSNKIITTNYDTAFQMAIKELRRYTAYQGKPYELTLHKDPKKPLLFKLHGCYEAVDSMVLFPTQYNALYDSSTTDAEHSLSVLKNIIYNKSVLFIGCGMGDFQINNIFLNIKNIQGEYNQKHFIIDKKPLDSSLSFLTHIPIYEYSEILSITGRLLEEKEKFEEEKPERLLKKQLAETETKLIQVEKQLKENITKDKLLRREAFRCFERGIKFNLDNEWESALKEYQIATEINTILKLGLYEVHANLGMTLGRIAQTKSGEEAESLYLQAFKNYREAIMIEADLPRVFFSWGTDLWRLAKTKSGEEAENLYLDAFKKFLGATDFNPDYAEAYNNWGNAMDNLARIKSGAEAEELYSQAFGKFQKAIDVRHSLYQAHYSWGLSLMNLAKIKSKDKAEKLYHLSCEKFKTATEIKPDFYQAFYNWGGSLLFMAQMKSGEEKIILIMEALEKTQKAADLGAVHYNLACSYALLSNKKNALHYLDKSLINKEITVEHVHEDMDWKEYQNDGDFQKIIQKYYID